MCLDWGYTDGMGVPSCRHRARAGSSVRRPEIPRQAVHGAWWLQWQGRVLGCSRAVVAHCRPTIRCKVVPDEAWLQSYFGFVLRPGKVAMQATHAVATEARASAPGERSAPAAAPTFDAFQRHRLGRILGEEATPLGRRRLREHMRGCSLLGQDNCDGAHRQDLSVL